MEEKCDGCVAAHQKIESQEIRITNLEKFRKWAEPILNDLKILRSDIRWMKYIASLFSIIVAWVYMSQVSPFFEKQSDDKIEIIKQQNKDKIEIIREINKIKEDSFKGRIKLRDELMEKFNQSTKAINRHNTSASKENYRGISKVIRKEVRSIKK